MSIDKLPYEVQIEIMDYLQKRDIKQYNLTSRACRQAAVRALFKHVTIGDTFDLSQFIELLVESPFVAGLIQKLSFTCDNRHIEQEPYVRLIQLTPNVVEVYIYRNGNLMRSVEKEIQKGYWLHLRHIKVNLLDNVFTSLSQSYYSIASAIKDRLLNLQLDITFHPRVSTEPQCFRFPLLFTRETRFHAVKELSLCDGRTTNLQLLDDAIHLCPNLTDFELFIHHCSEYPQELLHVQPYAALNRLRVKSFSIPKAYLDYLYLKFPRVNSFDLQVKNFILPGSREPAELMRQSTEMMAQLTDYVHLTQHCKLSISSTPEMRKLFIDIFLPRWEGSTRHTCLRGIQYFVCQKPDKKKLEMAIQSQNWLFRDVSADMASYLGQINHLELNDSKSDTLRVLAHCCQLESLSITFGTRLTYRGPVLPVTDLRLCFQSYYTYQTDTYSLSFINRFTRYTPHLKTAAFRFTLDPKNGFNVLHMSSISFDSLTMIFGRDEDKSRCYVHLVQSGVETYYQLHESQLRTISSSDFKAAKPTSKYRDNIARIRLICKDIKCLRIKMGSHEAVKDDF